MNKFICNTANFNLSGQLPSTDVINAIENENELQDNDLQYEVDNISFHDAKELYRIILINKMRLMYLDFKIHSDDFYKLFPYIKTHVCDEGCCNICSNKKNSFSGNYIFLDDNVKISIDNNVKIGTSTVRYK